MLTNSAPDGRRGAQTPRVANFPPYAETWADDCIELAEDAGLVLDDWQRYVLTHGLGVDLGGRWSSTRVGCWVPRQNGKGGIIEALELGWLFLGGERLILHSAHEYKTAQEAYLRLKDLVQGAPDLDRKVERYWQANDQQGISLKPEYGGTRLRFVARSRTSGRGFSGDKNILDEGQELTGLQMAALMPTISARPNPQIWFFGTPPQEPDAWIYKLKADGEAGKPRLAWFDWGAELDLEDPEDQARVHDRDLWYETNPAMGEELSPGVRVLESIVEDEASPSGLGDEFPYERLGVWRPPAASGAILDIRAWNRMHDADSSKVPLQHVALAVDITPMRTWSTIAAYGLREDGREHMQLLSYDRGTEWVVDRLRELRDELNPICIAFDSKNGAHALLPELAEFGIVRPEDREEYERDPIRGDLLELDTPAAVDAVAQFVDAFRLKPPTFAHLAEPQLDAAVANAQARPIGDNGQIGWGRKASEVDIGPLVAVTNARYGYHLWRDVVIDPPEPSVWSI